ncbi:hypothetical protein, partial [Streptomyces massasporeus]|uniref:hypothetical protein n=1 Tax=Streptomyces massasporeus TaxID=67324 RepID=UPI0033C5A7A0
AEAIGAQDPALDAELLILADQAYRSLGLRRHTGQPRCAGRPTGLRPERRGGGCTWPWLLILWWGSIFRVAGRLFEIPPHCSALVLNQPTLIREVQNRSAVAAQLPIFGRRATRLAEPVAHLIFSFLRHDTPEAA